MSGHEFDELVARLKGEASRRNAVKGIVGGALASVGVVSVASAKSGKGKRTVCSCSDTDPNSCETVRVKSNKVKKLLNSQPNSYRGACDNVTTTSTSSTSTTSSTTSTSTSSTTLP